MSKLALRLPFSVALILALAIHPMAMAQDDDAPPESSNEVEQNDEQAETAEPDGNTRVLEKIVVTAQKVEQTLEQVAASVSTMDGQFIRENAAFGFPDLQNYAANTEIVVRPSGARIRMRGFGTQSANVGFEPSVGTVVDGVFYGRTEFLSAFFHDLDRVEVLRGPQGTLFGKNSTAGVLNVVTESPQLDDTLSGHLDILNGSHGDRLIRPAFSVPLGDGVAMRIAGSYTNNDGRLRNTLLQRSEEDVEQTTTRGKLLIDLGAPWVLEFGAVHSRQRLNNGIYQLFDLSPDMLTLARDFDSQVETDPFNELVSANVPTTVVANFSGTNANLDYHFNDLFGMADVTLTSITAWAKLDLKKRDIDADFSPIPVIKNSLIRPSPFSQFSQEIRVTANNPDFYGFGYGFEFVTGAYYYRSKLLQADRFELEELGAAASYFAAAESGNSGGGGGGAFFPGQGTVTAAVIEQLIPLIGVIGQEEQNALTQLDQTTEAMALFGQWEYWFKPNWSAIGGLRLGTERKRGIFDTESNGDFVTAVADIETFHEVVDRKESDVSPKLGLKWEPVEDVHLYSTWSRGFKSGGFNAIALTSQNLDFEPERATSYEFGVKSRLLGGSMRVSAALYHTDFSNLQVSTFENGSFFILNAAEARSQGFEADLNWLPPIPGTNLVATIGYADAIFTSYPNAPGLADSQGEGTSVPLLAPGEPPRQDLSGRTLPNAPVWTGSIIPSFTLGVPWFNIAVTIAGDIIYRDDRYLDVDLDERTLQKATTEYNARLSITHYLHNWTLSFSGKNLGNEQILEQVLDQPLAPGNFAAVRLDRGRYYTAHLSWDF